MRRSVRSMVRSAILLAPLAAFSLSPAFASNGTFARPAAHAAAVDNDRHDDHGLLAVNGELLAGGILLMAGSAYALRRSRQ